MAEEETWEDINEHVRQEWKESTTPFERVYEVLEMAHEGRSAADVADRALVSEPTARRHCEALVNTGFADAEQDGRTTLYKRNEDRVLMTRIRALREQADREELIEGIREMKSKLHELEEKYDAVSPEELSRQLPGDDADGWEDVTAWRTTRQNLAVAQAALAYDEASDALAV